MENILNCHYTTILPLTVNTAFFENQSLFYNKCTFLRVLYNVLALNFSRVIWKKRLKYFKIFEDALLIAKPLLICKWTSY